MQVTKTRVKTSTTILQKSNHTNGTKDVYPEPRELYPVGRGSLVWGKPQMENVAKIRHYVVRHDNDINCFDQVNGKDQPFVEWFIFRKGQIIDICKHQK